jgi:hypothetical protein
MPPLTTRSSDGDGDEPLARGRQGASWIENEPRRAGASRAGSQNKRRNWSLACARRSIHCCLVRPSTPPYEGPVASGQGTASTSMDGIALTGWMYSSTMEDGTPGAPSVAPILGCPCMGALAPKNGCKMAIGRGCVRPPPGPETAQKRLTLAPVVPAGGLGM